METEVHTPADTWKAGVIPPQKPPRRIKGYSTASRSSRRADPNESIFLTFSLFSDSDAEPSARPLPRVLAMADGVGACGSVDEFLSQCRHSGDAAYAAFRSVLERLEDPSTRVRARIFLSDLQRRLDSPESSEQCFDKFHFQIEQVGLDQYQGNNSRSSESVFGWSSDGCLSAVLVFLFLFL